ncbi:MAG: S8 family serine peptidase [Flavobacteriales bacterium]
MKKLLTVIALISPVFTIGQIATRINWTLTEGTPDSVAWSSSIVDGFGNIITIGNAQGTGNRDIYIQSVGSWGGLNWSGTFDYDGGDDYGIQLVSDQNGGAFAVGVGTSTSTTQEQDIVVLRVSSTGNLDWMNSFNGIANLNDIPSDIAYIPTMGGILAVCGGTQTADSTTDMVTIVFNEINGDTLWTYLYDYAGGNDGGVGIGINSTPEIITVGVSADSNGLYDNVLVKLQSNGAPSDTVRTTMGIGIDEPRAIGQDTFGNWYVTGFYQDSPTNSSITIFKLDTGLNVLWSQNLDPTTGIDRPTDLYVDSVANVYVSGYVSDGALSRSYITRIDSNGTLAWERTYKLPGKSIQGLKLGLDTAGGIMMLGLVDDGVQNDLFLARYLSNGSLYLARTVHLNGDQRATDVLADHVNRIYITGQTIGDTVDDYFTMKFDWTENDMTPVLDSNAKPLFVGDELLIRFNPDSMDVEFVNNRNLEYGELYDIVSPAVITAMNQYVSFDFGRQTAFKIFRSITVADSITTSRQGHLVRQPKLWSALNVQVPDTVDFNNLQANLESLFPMIYYTDLNRFGELHGVPDDIYYDTLADLHPTTTYPSGHVNVEPAWKIETGNSNIRVGVYDSGLEWDHEDFQFQGNSIVQDVWDFQSNSSLMTTAFADSGNHGTPIGGIIGAVRNNAKGVSGIAGGHDSTNAAYAKQGVNLYGLKIVTGNFYSPVLTYVAEAIYESTLSSSQSSAEFAYGIHLQNHSWSFHEGSSYFIDTNINLLRDATRQTFRNGVAMFCARGNDGDDSLRYPACYDDNWVINVGGTGTDGSYNEGSNCEDVSSFGHNVDIAAPASSCLTARAPFAVNVTNNYYFGFGGTSGATPHATGTGALLCSYLNSSTFTVAPEDIEWLIQLSATDVYTSGPDDHTGYGRLNIGETIKLVEKPMKKLEHHGTSSTSGNTSTSIYDDSVQVELLESFENDSGQYFAPGLYIADVYEISTTVNHTIDTTDTIIGYWTRNDLATVLPLYNNSNELRPHEEALWVSAVSETQAELKGYVYLLRDWPNGTNVLGWIPQDTVATNAILEYTLLIHPKSLYADTNDSIIDSTNIVEPIQTHNSSFSIHPNPTLDRHSIEIVNSPGSIIKIELYDITGRRIQSTIRSIDATNEKIDVDVSHLTNGVYFYYLTVGDKHEQLSFIKSR